MNRIDKKLNDEGKLLSIYFTAGYPSLNDTQDIIIKLEESGVDMIEIGLPFSDPLADGPIIHDSSIQAIKNGMNSNLLFDQLKNIRDAIQKLIIENASFAKNANTGFFVRVDSFSDSSIDMLVQAFTETNDWGEYLKIKEELAVNIINIIENNNAGFAFPSQSIYVESLHNDAIEIFNPKK